MVKPSIRTKIDASKHAYNSHLDRRMRGKLRPKVRGNKDPAIHKNWKPKGK